jgi:hypothetical protein
MGFALAPLSCRAIIVNLIIGVVYLRVIIIGFMVTCIRLDVWFLRDLKNGGVASLVEGFLGGLLCLELVILC